MDNKEKQNNFEKKEQKVPEKRRTPRIKREVIVQYQIKELAAPEGLQVFRKPHADVTRTKDLAENGLFFTGSSFIPPQTILNIKLRLPTEKEFIQLDGRVIDCEEIKEDFLYKIRVEFTNLNDAQKGSLRNFVQLFLKG